VQGTFYLHPNQAGAVALGQFWANAIAASLNFSTNNSYVAWLQSGDLNPGAPGTGFNETPTNALVANGLSYGAPNGLLTTITNNPTSFNLTADIRNDPVMTAVLQSSTNLIDWNPIAWSISANQSGVATGFVRYLLQDQSVSSENKKFYRVQLNH